jgi:hypothetical protein
MLDLIRVARAGLEQDGVDQFVFSHLVFGVGVVVRYHLDDCLQIDVEDARWSPPVLAEVLRKPIGQGIGVELPCWASCRVIPSQCRLGPD